MFRIIYIGKNTNFILVFLCRMIAALPQQMKNHCFVAAASQKCGKTTGIFNTDDNIQRILLNNDAQF